MKFFLTLIECITRPFFLFPVYRHKIKQSIIRRTRLTALAGKMFFKMAQIAFFEFVVLLLPKY
jgi:hypothetical protein